MTEVEGSRQGLSPEIMREECEMNIYEVAKKAVNEGSAQKIRHRGGNQYDCQEGIWTGNNRRWMLLDHFTASAIVQIYEALKPENQAKYVRLPLDRLLNITWKLAA